MRNCEKSLRQALASRVYKLMQKWAPGECLRVPPRHFCMPVRTISMLAMQVMGDIALEAASILELERKDTLTVDAINTAAKLVCRDGKDGENACRPFLELNLVRYGSFKYTHYMDNIEPNPLPSLP
jgi:hypothetical protein